MDYIRFFIRGEGSAYFTKSAFAYQTPALTAMYNYCLLTANEEFLRKNAADFEKYFLTWEERHLTKNGLYWSIDDREGTEFSISGTCGTVVTRKVLKGFAPDSVPRLENAFINRRGNTVLLAIGDPDVIASIKSIR